jgi:hypothetical protein
MRHRIVFLARIGPEEVLQATTSQLLEGVSPSNVSFGSASGLARNDNTRQH